jgi:hypothetical protein
MIKIRCSAIQATKLITQPSYLIDVIYRYVCVCVFGMYILCSLAKGL